MHRVKEDGNDEYLLHDIGAAITEHPSLAGRDMVQTLTPFRCLTGITDGINVIAISCAQSDAFHSWTLFVRPSRFLIRSNGGFSAMMVYVKSDKKDKRKNMRTCFGAS